MTTRVEEVAKRCEFCNKTMKRKRFNGRLEDFSVFKKRRFCSLTCANSKKGKLTKHGYSFRARKHLKSACEACGYTRAFHAHHLDQDITNNTVKNIQTLCKHCHDFWHTTQKRVGKKVAGKMPRLC